MNRTQMLRLRSAQVMGIQRIKLEEWNADNAD